MYFVGFYSMPNLIIIIFNFLYPVFIVGFDCKGCVLEKESVNTKEIEARRFLVGISLLSFPRSEACALHMTEMQRVSTGWRHVSREYLGGKAFPRDTRETFCSVSLYYLIYTFCTHTLYAHITHKC